MLTTNNERPLLEIIAQLLSNLDKYWLSNNKWGKVTLRELGPLT